MVTSRSPSLPNSNPTTKTTSQELKIILRPATLADISTMAYLARTAYANTAVSNFISPRADQYPGDSERRFRQSSHKRHVNLRNLNIVACLASSPETPIAYVQALRLGDDAGARAFMARRGIVERVWLWGLRWWFWAYHGVVNRCWPDHSLDVANNRLFLEWMAKDDERYWSPSLFPERRNRWFVQSLVVGPSWQGQGIGKKLMGEVVRRADEEGVPCGLGASSQGQRLYWKLGFVDLGDFWSRVPNEREDEVGGGVMVRWPKEGKKDL